MPSKAIGVSRASAKPKIRAAEQVQLDESLEEAVCNYIDNSEVNPGEGMTLDHLSREDSFHHPDKPKGKGSQRVLKTLLEGMPSLLQDTWEGQICFKLAKKSHAAEAVDTKIDPLYEADEIVKKLEDSMETTSASLHPATARVSVPKKVWQAMLDELKTTRSYIRTAMDNREADPDAGHVGAEVVPFHFG